ncbi:hypothetical protein [Brevibacillus reuszeri]|nr:hypothetical protein [Brevibacillus reuszeri]
MKDGLAIIVISLLTLVMGVFTYMADSSSVNPQTIGVFDHILRFLNTWGT